MPPRTAPFVVMLLTMCLALGCDREPSRGLRVRRSRSVNYTEKQLNNILVPGMTAAAVSNAFGPPGVNMELNPGVIMWTYMYPLQPANTTTHLAGFSVYLTNGTVARWSPVIGMPAERTFDPANIQNSAGMQPFELYLETENLTNLANAVALKGSADATNLKTAPDLAFKAQVFSGKKGDESSGEQTVILVISEQDAARMKATTEGNTGKRLLIVCRNRVVAAPVITVPLDSRQVTFTVKTGIALDTIQSN